MRHDHAPVSGKAVGPVSGDTPVSREQDGGQKHKKSTILRDLNMSDEGVQKGNYSIKMESQ